MRGIQKMAPFKGLMPLTLINVDYFTMPLLSYPQLNYFPQGLQGVSQTYEVKIGSQKSQHARTLELVLFLAKSNYRSYTFEEFEKKLLKRHFIIDPYICCRINTVKFLFNLFSIQVPLNDLQFTSSVSLIQMTFNPIQAQPRSLTAYCKLDG